MASHSGTEHSIPLHDMAWNQVTWRVIGPSSRGQGRSGIMGERDLEGRERGNETSAAAAAPFEGPKTPTLQREHEFEQSDARK